MAASAWRISDIAALLAALVLCWTYLSSKYSRRRLPLPPGPKPLPILGNLRDVPNQYPWARYKKWAKTYGDVISMTVFGNVIIVVNSHAALKELVLGAPASVFSGRPSIKIAEITGKNEVLTLRPYDKGWRDRRRVVDNHFRATALQRYQHVQKEKLAVAMKRLVREPAQYIQHIRQYTGAIILSIVYGYDVKETDDPWIAVAEESVDLATRYLLPGALLVNTLPILARLPPWMLGTHFDWLVKRIRRLDHEVKTIPWEWVKDGMRKGTARQSLVRDAIAELTDSDGDAERVNIDAFGTIFAAAADTTVAVLSTFFLAMRLHPSIQAKARAELDAVVGRDRLPSFEDRQGLPYVEAVLMEVLRWQPVTPQGIPHVADEDVIWNEYCIPEGAMIIGNAWAILHDADTYPDPESFNPSRFLIDAPGGQRVRADPLLDYLFGFGARRCPGRHLADATLWLFVACVLATFEIHPKTEKEAEGAAVADAITAGEALFPGKGMIIHPLPFECTIEPRDAQALHVIEDA